MEAMSAGADAIRAGVNSEWLRALALTQRIVAQPNRVLPVIIGELAQTLGEHPALLSERECLSYGMLAERVNRYARWALGQELGKGEVVALLMPSCPEYMAIWLGITLAGGVVALLNTNLSGVSLAHCIDIAGAERIIVATELLDAFSEAQPHLTSDPKVWLHGGDTGDLSSIERMLERASGEPLGRRERAPPAISDRALLIYTSGTTGLPKAANISHRRLLTWSLWFAGMMDTRPSDRMYNCLPMYHSVGGIVATGAVLVNGGSVVIRDRFSARQFWDDITRWDCTLFQYIGELCRYLALAGPHPREAEHRIRLCCGNGLRPDIWQTFKDRFHIPRILEFYASTEGNVTLFNCEGKPGALGRIPPFLAHRSPTALVRFDVEKGAVVRNAQGRCVRCRTDETGEAIGRISEARSDPGSPFEGYTNSRDTQQKILRDVFESGDAWFRTGDLMRTDKQGFFYFIDRIGDTFRWKGENVSTTDVAQAITAFAGVVEANVYGVRIPGTEGRAGMAAIVVDERFELAAFNRHLARRLPAYARPLFLRLVREVEITVTFKQKKADLVADGYNPKTLQDPIYFNDASRQCFVPLDDALHAAIEGGQVRL
jgi:fatty-acyl-CoA synthase